ncbi:MAG TPA: DUF3306 domain-containing protein [Stellaceae bacterium]|nr:DUF3306 domain-containing protein [Stellaceae bacterium]
MAEPGDFLSRWSRLKRRAQAEPRDGIRSGTARPTLDQAANQPEVESSDSSVQPPVAKQDETLPPIETLGKDSDYTPFMRSDVPDALRNAALRKLWQSDPVFANLDGLVDYAEDFGASFALGGAVATVYRVLEGMPDPPEKRPPQPAESGSPTAPSPAGGAASAVAPARSRARDGTRECKSDEVVELDEHIDLE